MVHEDWAVSGLAVTRVLEVEALMWMEAREGERERMAQGGLHGRYREGRVHRSSHLPWRRR